MNKIFSVCGSECSACEYLKKSECRGCSEIKGRVFWAVHVSADVCPIYNCVTNEKKLKDCGACAQIPCKLWRDLKDPSDTDEKHEANIKTRVQNLKGL